MIDAEPGGFLVQGANRPFKRRIVGLSIALAIEALLLLLLISIGYGIGSDDNDGDALVTFSAQDFAEDTPADEPDPAPTETEPVNAVPPIQPLPESVEPAIEPIPDLVTPTIIVPVPVPLPDLAAAPQPVQPAPPRAASPPRNYGPPGGGSSGPRDSRRVGTASNGEPLYAARWFREPTDQELAGYLSTASGPGSALIECRTVPDFRVEDCNLLGEVPQGSQIGRAVLAAAWQFRVRPARVGGRSQIGSWVRIRIDYTRTPQPR